MEAKNGKAKLYAALAKFQGEVKPAKFDKVNPAFKSRYATLAAIFDAIRAPLAKHGLAVMQMPEAHADGLALRTRLTHESGESEEFVSVVPIGKRDAQGWGSALTYARRYGLSSALGIVADEDDDGNSATTHEPQRQTTPEPREASVLRACESEDQLRMAFEAMPPEMRRRLASVKDDMKAKLSHKNGTAVTLG